MARSEEVPAKPAAKREEKAEPRPRPAVDTPTTVAPDPWPKGTRVIQKVIRLQNETVNVEDVARLLAVFPVRVSVVRGLGTIAVAGAADAVAAVEEVVRQIDVPRPTSQRRADRNIEFVAHLILAQHTTGGGLDPVPAELDPVLAQLKGLLTYRSYGLIDTALLRTRESAGTSTNGTIRAVPPNLKSGFYGLTLNRIGLSSDDKGRLIGAAVHLQANLVEMDGSKELHHEGNIDTTLDLREGQKVVVGKANIDGSQSALILVLSAKVID
jgi:hypothetical protein